MTPLRRILAAARFGLFVGQIANSLLRVQVKLDPVPFVIRVDEAEGMAAKPVHVAVGGRNAPVAHHDRDLVQRLR